MAALPQRFLFDIDFDEPGPDDEATTVGSHMLNANGDAVEDVEEIEEPEVPSFTEEELAEAKDDGFKEGLAQAEAQYHASTEVEILNLIRDISGNLTELSSVQERENTDRLREAVAVAAAICRKIIPDLVEKNAIDEVTYAVREAIQDLNETPRILLTVAPALRGPLADRLESIVAGAGYDGRIEILEDASLDHGDCLMSWGDGGADRRLSDLWSKVTRVIDDGIGNMTESLDRANPQPHPPETVKPEESKSTLDEAAAPTDSPELADAAPAAEPEPTEQSEATPLDRDEMQPSPEPVSDTDAANEPTPSTTPETVPKSEAVETQAPEIEAENLESAAVGVPPADIDPEAIIDAAPQAKPIERAPVPAASMPSNQEFESMASDTPTEEAIVRQDENAAFHVFADNAGYDDKMDASSDATEKTVAVDPSVPFVPSNTLDLPPIPTERHVSGPVPSAAESADMPDNMYDGMEESDSAQPSAPQNALELEVDEEAEEGGVVDDALDRALGSLTKKRERKAQE